LLLALLLYLSALRCHYYIASIFLALYRKSWLCTCREAAPDVHHSERLENRLLKTPPVTKTCYSWLLTLLLKRATVSFYSQGCGFLHELKNA